MLRMKIQRKQNKRRKKNDKQRTVQSDKRIQKKKKKKKKITIFSYHCNTKRAPEEVQRAIEDVADEKEAVDHKEGAEELLRFAADQHNGRKRE
jgi:hypothetical protein